MKRMKLVLLIALLALGAGLYGCAGDDGATGATGATGPAGPIGPVTANAESCAVCHSDAATIHEYARANPLTGTLDSVEITGTTLDTVTLNFSIANNGAAFSASDVLSGWTVRIYASYLDAATGQWVQYAGGYATVTSTTTDNGDSTFSVPFAATTALVTNATNRFSIQAYGYLADLDNSGTYSSSVDLRGFVNLNTEVVPDASTQPTRDLVSLSACLNCHYDKAGLAHGTRLDPNLCVQCHQPAYMAAQPATTLTDGERFEMVNMIHGVHNSHHISGYDLSRRRATDPPPTLTNIGYPQSMTNCATCHTSAVQLTNATAEDNFAPALCKSCHGGADKAWSWANFPSAPSSHSAYTEATNCAGCHAGTGAIGPKLAAIHNGYDTSKYNAQDLKYVDPIVTVNGDGTIAIEWGAENAAGTVAYDVTNESLAAGPVFYGLPAARNNVTEGVRILVGYYGWGTHDVATYDNYNSTALPAITTYNATTGRATTTVTLDATKIADNSATKGVVAVIGVPEVAADNEFAAIRSVATDFNLDGTAVTARAVASDDKCDACHDSILIHTNSSYGHTAVGNVNACVLCHNVSAAAGHYADQSRSLKSYIHAIHAGQATFSSYAVEGIEYPNILQNCEACHDAGTYDAPDQLLSSGGVVASTVEDTTTGRGDGNNKIMGPGAIACGSCHVVVGADPVAIRQHTGAMGYNVPTADSTFQEVMDAIFEFLK